MVVFIIILVVVVALIVALSVSVKKGQNNLKKLGFDPKEVVYAKYTCGHPELNNPERVGLAVKDKTVFILSLDKVGAQITGDSIKNIVIEDETTFTNKVTLARMALVGIFAFALKKRKKNELAYLTIQWNDGKFDHETIFEYESAGSLQKANTDRNKIITALK